VLLRSQFCERVIPRYAAILFSCARYPGVRDPEESPIDRSDRLLAVWGVAPHPTFSPEIARHMHRAAARYCSRNDGGFVGIIVTRVVC
jgi:hypothetical protein